MRGLNARDCLDLSDDGARLDWTARGLLLLSAAWPEGSTEASAELPLGVRDRLVLALRVHTFGPRMRLRCQCRSCGSALVAQLDLAGVLAAYPAEPPPEVRVIVDGQTVTARLPTSEDVLAATALGDGQAEWGLYERCLTSPRGGDPERIRHTVAEAMAEADPLIALEIELECEACHARFAEPFDIVSCFWKEIETSAARASLEVHALASEYGWSESEILAMSPARRARYVALRDR